MELLNYYEKKVKITDFEGKQYIGFVSNYVYPEDNEDEQESLIVDTDECSIEFTQEEIKSIQIIY